MVLDKSLINSSYNFSEVLCFKIKPFLLVSGKPPLFEVIGIDPCAVDSIGNLPNGSDHFDGAIEINAFL